MDPNPLRDDFSLLSGGAELLDRVEPLWSHLRRHHAELAPQWGASLLAGSFDGRRKALINKAARGILVTIAIAPDQQDIGYCVSTIASDATGEVDSLYVVPSHRSRGIGHALMSAAMDWFQKHSIQSIHIDVIAGNDDAQRFYARYGFLPRTVRMIRPRQ